MSTIAANGSFSNVDSSSQSPPKPASPASPTFTPSTQSANRYYNIIRGQNAPFPTTPTSANYNSTLEPPSNVSYADFIRTWTDVHVARWLNDIKCSSHASTFKANDIRGDILLELDQVTLKEMGISSIGDRLRIVNAVKSLRQRVSARSVSTTPTHEQARSTDSGHHHTSSTDSRDGGPFHRQEPRRPPPLNLQNNNGRGDLPHIVREHPPDSGRPNPIRPLPQPNATPAAATTTTPSSSHIASSSSSSRGTLPPLPPIPRSQPPQPPSARGPTGRLLNTPPTGRRTPTQEPPAYTNQGLPPPPANQTPPAWANKAPEARSNSPLGHLRRGSPNVHGRNGSLGMNSPGGPSPSKLPRAPAANNYPYANSSLQPPVAQQHNLSPISESFTTQHGSSGTPSPPVNYQSTRPTYAAQAQAHAHANAPSLDDLRRKLVKFLLPDNNLTYTIDVASCTSGAEILEKVLKKIGTGGLRGEIDSTEQVMSDDHGLSIDGWGVYLNMGQNDGPAAPLTELELLSICQDRDHPIREHGLTLRKTHIARIGSTSPAHGKFLQTAKDTKRASSISILSGLGVDDPEKALDPPSPTQSDHLSTISQPKRPSKLRNFFGQRPPSELITNHLTEYFPFTEKKVLERTARHSMLRSNTIASRRDSTASAYQSRFSTSTQGSQPRRSISPTRSSMSSSGMAPPLPNNAHLGAEQMEDIPRVSLSTEDGRSIELRPDDGHTNQGPSLPPIPFPSQSLSESLESITGPGIHPHRASRTPSLASRRMSYMTELRSKRDRSDTASLMTVDEITAEVESRTNLDQEMEEWTKVETDEGGEDTLAGSTLNEVNEQHQDEDEETEEGGEREEEEDEAPGKPVQDGAIKWIKGALIGAGSFGKVYLGMDATNGLLMAVKQVELPTGPGPNTERKKAMLSALEREIELLNDLQHPNIVQYLYSSIDEEHLNIFLEYVPGGSVTALLRNYGAFEEPLVKNFVRQILEGLNYLHERDIIHRDIKGGNILVDNKGGVKISDFGISKKVDDSPIAGNKMHRPSLQGSVFWMAPEVVKQSVHTQKADIWSVGCLVVEMLTGEHPWAQLTQMQAIFKIGSSAQPTIPSDISQEAQDFLQSTFKLDHEARPTAIELLKHPWISTKKSSK
ncbi:Pkinase-domain-containing protein [Pluteus cervinus]|uniref:Pkinase-domain-containing protein n=1 Tax=Pluteus cervinus TaxID=181527 RepID=A0ACD3BED7_9AGAR|nr:Pkinase-domain-containing protein [Pluteus cervinus]